MPSARPKTFRGIRVLVTGGTGFIGSHLVRRLVASGASVHVLARQHSSPWRIEDVLPRVSLWTGDVSDNASVERCVAGGQPQVIFHVAGNTDVRRLDDGLTQVGLSLRVNLEGTLNLLRAAHIARASVARFVRTGGLEEYGRGPTPYDERQRESPISPYSASQVSATHYCQMLQPYLGFPVVTLRLALVYGPAQPTGFLIPDLMTHCLEGRDYVMTSGTQGRDLIYVGDVVEAMMLAARAPGLSGEVINIGTGQEHRIRDVARAIVKLTGSRTRLKIGSAARRRFEIRHLFCRTRKAKRLLRWCPGTGLEEGLTRTVAWYREHGARADLTGA